jgi:hypothetical protein
VTLEALAFALIAALGGAALTAIAGAIGAKREATREHKTWRRDRRFEAYAAVAALIRKVEQSSATIEALTTKGDAIHAKVQATPDPLERKRFLERNMDLLTELDEFKHRNAALMVEFADVAGAFDVLGPKSLEEPIGDLMRAITSGDSARIEPARAKFLKDAKHALEIED